MSLKQKMTLWEALSSPANYFVGDTNIGRLGSIELRWELPRQSGGSYPYKSSPESEFEEKDKDEKSDSDTQEDPTDSIKFFNKFMGRIGQSDSLAAHSVDKQHYTPTGADPWLREAYGGRHTTSTSIVPIPGLYGKMQRGAIGASPSPSYSTGVRTRRKTGTKKGLASPHRPTVPEYSRWDSKENERVSADYDENSAVSKIRQIVKHIHADQERAGK